MTGDLMIRDRALRVCRALHPTTPPCTEPCDACWQAAQRAAAQAERDAIALLQHANGGA